MIVYYFSGPCEVRFNEHARVRIMLSKLEVEETSNKPGTAQVGAISKAQKQQKDFQVFSSTVPEKPKS